MVKAIESFEEFKTVVRPAPALESRGSLPRELTHADQPVLHSAWLVVRQINGDKPVIIDFCASCLHSLHMPD
jgi:hypothetical protein